MKKFSLLSLAAVGALVLTGCGKESKGTKVSAEKFKDNIDEKLPEHVLEAMAVVLGSVDVKYSLDMKAASLGGEDAKESGKVTFAYSSETQSFVSTDPEFNSTNYRSYQYVETAVNRSSLWQYAGSNMSKEDFVANFGEKGYSLYVTPYMIDYSITTTVEGASAVGKEHTEYNKCGFAIKNTITRKVKDGDKTASLKVSISLSYHPLEAEE